jgi:endonuclease V-like protein UPF0215 family
MIDATLHTNDVKVILINSLCMLIFNIVDVNHFLQALLFIATIFYTVVRIFHEVKKIRENGKAD